MLSHIKVIELADGLGAYAGRILASLGADVLKIEPPGGQSSRRSGAVAASRELNASLDWLAWNLGKRGLTLDLDQTDDRERLVAQLAVADVVIQGGGDGLATLGLGHEALSKLNPALIDLIVAPFAEGAARGAPANDLTLMAMSGIMNMVGDPDRPPLKLPGQQAYALAGVQGAIAVLLALNARAGEGGHGQRVWVSAYQSAVLAGYRDPIVWEWTGRIGQRTGNRLVRGKSGVRQVWPVADGFVTWSLVDNPGMVKGMVGLMQADGAAGPLAEVDWDNILLADAPQDQIEAWETVLEAWFKTKPKAQLAQLSAERGLGLSQIDGPEDALANEHWTVRGFWTAFDDPARGLSGVVPGPLFLTSAMEPLTPAPAPAAEH